MDVEEDIRKIENFLKNLKGSRETDPATTTTSPQETNKHHNANVSSCSNNLNTKYTLLQSCLSKNEECERLLTSLESSLSLLLEECLKEQKIVREGIEARENRKVGENSVIGHSRSQSICKICSSPYFKDIAGFSSQNNDDFNQRKCLGYLNPWDILKTTAWCDDQKRTLEKSIKEMDTQQLAKSSVQSHQWVKQEIANSNEVECSKNVSVGEVNGAIVKEYDWIKISVMDLQNARSPSECCAMWYNYLHPMINKKRWTERESETLKKLANKYEYQDWETIACDLGTGRSAYQCIGHYKIRLSDTFKVKWTDEETVQLAKYINMFKVCHFIPWFKIGWLMDRHTTSEILRKSMRENADLKKGRFSLEEDILLVAGMKEFGNNWSQIAEYFPNRHTTQLRGRQVTLKGRSQCFQPWTQYEDNLLKKLVQKYGFGNWRKISTHFLNRTNVQIRTRFKSLMRWKAKVGSDNIPVPADNRPAKDGHSVKALWEIAKKMVQEKQLKMDNSDTDENSDVNMVHELYQILKPRQKPGRKKGTTNFSSFHKQFYNFFNVSYSQRGGRGKEICVESKIPGLAYQAVLALQLLDAKICLPSKTESIYRDCSMLEMDKSVISFLINSKEPLGSKCTFIKFQDSLSEHSDVFASGNDTIQLPPALDKENERHSEWFPVCPPNVTTFIGLRTMLLNRTNVKEQSKGNTVQNLLQNSHSMEHREFSLNRDKYRNECKLWNRRIGTLYTWAAFLSKMYPLDKFITFPTSEDVSSESTNRKRKKPRKRKKKNKTIGEKDKNGGNTEIQVSSDTAKPEKQKRSYVKSGKYSLKSRFGGSTRISTRHTKVDA